MDIANVKHIKKKMQGRVHSNMCNVNITVQCIYNYKMYNVTYCKVFTISLKKKSKLLFWHFQNWSFLVAKWFKLLPM